MRSPLPLALSACLAVSPLLTRAEVRRSQPAPPLPRKDQLPVTHVSLYKNGIGFFEHTGRVIGDAAVTLDLTSSQLNDVLQSLTAIDLNGGHITGAGYNSTTPLDQQLLALPLSLGEQPTQQDLFQTLRGARVEITGTGAPFTGRILSLEVRLTSVSQDPSKPFLDRRFLTVIADSGATRTLELTSTTVVRLLDTPLRSDLTTYLELLNRNRFEGIRHLTLTDRGTGTRDLRVSFLSEVPIWKSTYRILTTDLIVPHGAIPPSKSQAATLQGFSVIDNTTGEDWNNVHLSLIAGSPQSFLQPLAQPIYTRRSEIPIAQDAELTPQTHDSAIPNDIKMLKEDGPPPPAVAGVAGMSGMSGGSAGGEPGGVLGAMGSAPPVAVGPGSSGNSGGGPRRLAGPLNGRQFNSSAQLAAPMQPYETIASGSTNPNTTTAAFDDLFAYNLTDPVTIPRNGSALVPILQTPIQTERVTLWSPSQPIPLRALWITNTSELTLDRGSFTLVENGSFGGEGLLDTIHPGERRLLSYAADQAVRVSIDHRNDARRVTTISVSKGVLKATSAEIAEVEYLVANAAPDARTVIVEQPRRPGWTLDSAGGTGSTDPKPAETTPTAYRFRVATAPKESVRLHIGERHTVDEFFRLVDATDDQLTLFLHNSNASPALLQQLEPVFAAKRALTTLDRQVDEKQVAITQLIEDQKRLRDNLAALKGSSEERSLAKRYTAQLNTQEDTLAALRRDLATLQTQHASAQQDLDAKIASLQINQTL